MTTPLPITGSVSISQQREEKSGFVLLVPPPNETVLLPQHKAAPCIINLLKWTAANTIHIYTFHTADFTIPFHINTSCLNNYNSS